MDACGGDAMPTPTPMSYCEGGAENGLLLFMIIPEFEVEREPEAGAEVGGDEMWRENCGYVMGDADTGPFDPV